MCETQQRSINRRVGCVKPNKSPQRVGWVKPNKSPQRVGCVKPNKSQLTGE
ncbi:hypothetical protein NIES39_J03780 [Arthrospira platensis NIES-39]|nr:hypothetical protein NIES39_J03780 [Arthrospira platensis NIES-39]